ncbi:unnamed protein product [Ixodes persulcatus]
MLHTGINTSPCSFCIQLIVYSRSLPLLANFPNLFALGQLTDYGCTLPKGKFSRPLSSQSIPTLRHITGQRNKYRKSASVGSTHSHNLLTRDTGSELHSLKIWQSHLCR